MGKLFIGGRRSVSIHALAKRATGRFGISGSLELSFNPRPREEGDLAGSVIEPRISRFNPRPREEGDQIRKICWRSAEGFNPRPREEGDIKRRCDLDGVEKFQSTPSRRGRLVFTSRPWMGEVSIHALAKRATRGLM